MMKRSANAVRFPGLWAPVGGHIETDEFDNPRAACLREIHEETGLAPEDISNLSLKYILFRLREEEIRLQYVYFGETKTRRIVDCDEGELHWVKIDEMTRLDTSLAIRYLMEHYLSEVECDGKIIVGVMKNQDGRGTVEWAELTDWETALTIEPLKLRLTAAGVFTNGRDFLMMKRAESRKLAPGMWAPVGGHLKPDELNDPVRACLRETEEETGIRPDQITGLALKYILVRKKEDEIRVHYVFTGETHVTETRQTSEGQLFWIDAEDIAEKEMPITIRFLFDFHLHRAQPADRIFVSVITSMTGKPSANWSELSDWE